MGANDAADMVYTIMLSKIIGICLTILPLGMLFNRKHFQAMAVSVVNTPAIHFLAALLPLILGSIIVITHTDYQEIMCILIGVIGWLLLIGGAFRALFPTIWVNTVSKHYASGAITFVMVILLLVGIALLYAGFVHPF